MRIVKGHLFMAGMMVLCAMAFAGCNNRQSVTTQEPDSERTIESSVSVTSETEVFKQAESVSENNEELNESVEVTDKRIEKTFFDIPSEFEFASGAGAWRTKIRISEDGSFVGNYEDWDAGDIGEGYSGVCYICNFSGKFSNPEPTDKPYVYSMKLLELSIDDDEEIGTEKIIDEALYIFSEPYGFDDADEFLLYLPGASLSDMTEECVSWLYFYEPVFTELPDGEFAIYNIGGKEAFLGNNDDSIWYRSFWYEYDNAVAEFVPAYSGSYLSFSDNVGTHFLGVTVPWNGKSTEPMECRKYFNDGTVFNITIVADEQTTAEELKYLITVECITNPWYDFSAWGSTELGKFSGVFTEVKE